MRERHPLCRRFPAVMALVLAGLSIALSPISSAAQNVSAPLPDAVSEGLQIFDPAAQGYVAEEYILRGTAPVLEPVTMVDTEDTSTLDNTAASARQESYTRTVIAADRPYATRMIVYRPADMDRFTGDVVVETMHPAGGGQSIVWSSINPFFTRRGHAYVIVQHPATFGGLQFADGERYGELSAEAYSQVWGMLADTGRLLKTTGIGGLVAERLYLTGYSFTGVSTATFANYHHDETRLQDGSPVYDAYFPMAGGMYMRDLDVPVMWMMTNSDFNIFGAELHRKPDSDIPGSQFRRYEIVGPSHSVARREQSGAAIPPPPIELPEAEGLPQFNPQACFAQFPEGYQPNDFPLRLAQAAMFRNLIAWVRDGTPPPAGALIEIDDNHDAVTDEHGNALGGVRLPPVSVPARTYGMGRGEACFLFGYTMPFPAEDMRRLYGDRASYVAAVERAAQAAVEQRALLPEGAIELVQWAREAPEF